ncbi:MAG: efflux transporter outer membrane subunit [Campylobacterales bacterium]|nr:efflux transporter outer membrane subunit [Campylobacterales bacterium]
MRSSLYLIMALLFMTSGCSMAPKLDLQTPELPASLEDANATSKIDDKWWEAFGDARLNVLIEEALSNNDDLKLAISSVALARAALGLSEAERYPTLNAGGSAIRQKTTGESLSPFLAGVRYDTFILSASAAYEFDFWGRYKNAQEAAIAELLASEADRETVRISLVSSVAELYFTLVALQRQISVTEETLHAYQESYDYRLRQYKHEAIDALTLEQAHALYANAKLALASLQETKVLSESALAILLGKSPQALFEERAEFEEALPHALQIPANLSSRLLEQRPDIRASQERLRASNALIGVARADYFPSISLTGSAGLQSMELGNLLNSSAKTWSFGPSLSIPLFDFGRTKNRVKSAQEQKNSALISYGKTVKNAFKEVYDSLKKIEISQQKLRAQEEEKKALLQVFALSQKRFDSGYGTYLEVVEAKRGLLRSRVNMISLNAELIINQITLYKALGGGWRAAEAFEQE